MDAASPTDLHRRRQLVDLAWLLVRVVRAAPVAGAIWFALSAGRGTLVPAQLWLTKRLVDALAAQVGAAVGVAGAPSAAGSNPSGATPALWGPVVPLLALLATVLAADRIMDGLAPWVEARVRQRGAAWLQERVMSLASRVPLVALEDTTYFDRLSRVLADPEGRGPQVIGEVMTLVRAVPAIAGYTAGLAVLTPVLPAMILAISLPTVWLYLSGGQLHFALVRRQTREQRLADYYAEVLTGRPFAKEVRLYGLSGYLVERWSALYWETRNAQRRLAFRLGLKQRGAVVASNVLTMLGLLWVIGSGLTHGTVGAYALLFQSFHGLTSDLFGLGLSLRTLGERSGAASDVRAFLALPAEQLQEPIRRGSGQGRRPFPRPLRDGVRFEDVSFTYPGADRPALEGISFTIGAGERVAIVGENGAGKTTLVKLLLGLYRPHHGRITVDGVDLLDIDIASLRSAASAVLQQFVHYQLTLRENVTLSDAAHAPSAVAAALERAGAARLVSRLPDGPETVLGPDVGGVDLSGGEWQRVALARAFYRDAEVLVLDEPTAALDPLAELSVFERFAELASGKTAVLISHRLGMARLADRVLMLHDARLVEDGPHDVLLQRGGEYAVLFGAQARWYT